MKKAPIPTNERERKIALDALRVLDTPSEEAFDQITALAAEICGTKISMVSLVDSSRQWFKSCFGLNATEAPRDTSFCGHAILGDDLFEVENSVTHPDFRDNPAVVNEPHVRFYAGAPLVTSGGFRIGTLCVVDCKEKKLTELQRRSLGMLAKQVVSMMELRVHRDSAQLVMSQLQEAQKIAQLGSWQFDFANQETSWSSELYRIFEIEEPQPQDQLYQLYRERVHPDDLPALERVLSRAIECGEDIVFDHRITLDGGKRIKFVQEIAKFTRDVSGKPIFLNGTCRDKTRDVESERKYRSLIETMSEGVIVQDAKGKVLQYNPAALRILDLDADQLTGRAPLNSKWQALREDGSHFKLVDQPAWSNLQVGKSISGVPVELRLSTGGVRWIRLNAAPIECTDGRRTIVTFSDVTREVRDETQIEKQRVLLESVLNNLPNMVFVKDYQKDLSFTLFNKSGEDLLGVKAQDVVGKSDYDFLSKEEADSFTRADRQAFEKGQIIRIDQERVSTPRGQRWLKTYKVPTFKSDGSPDLLIGISTDITEELELTKSLEAERAKAMHSAKLASLGEMSAGIAHEINNPLAIISGNVALLKRLREDPVRFNAKLETITKAAQRMAKIVSGLKKFSRSSERSVHHPETLENIINDALLMTESTASRKSVSIEIDLMGNPTILCDEVEIEQVLVNLISNGIDAAQLSAEKWVRLIAFEQGEQVVLHVIDSGAGISPEVELKLFEPFFTTKPVGEGTGLGLPIVKGILEQHQATITLNRKMKSTCFEIRFAKAPTVEQDVA